MDRFHSTYINKIDRKGRVSIPADFRAVLAKRGSTTVVLFPALHFPAVEGAAEDYLEDLERQIESLPPFSPERDDLIDSILPMVQRLGWDAEGRVVLPDTLLEQARLTEQAAFAGRGRTFQIWHPEALRARQEEARQRVQAQRAGARGAAQ